MILTAGQAFAKDIKADVENGMKKFFKDNGIGLNVAIEVMKKLEEPKGLYFIKMTLSEESSGRTQEQFVFSDGKYIMPDILTVDSNTSLKDVLTFESAENVKIDVSKLTLMAGKKNAKNIIIEVSDFQCPYCKKAYTYLHSEIEKRKLDAAVYMLHLPLQFHQKARIYAAIFEAGLQMGQNFAGDLFATDKAEDEMKDDEIIEMFAKKSGNPDKFKSLVKSPAITAKINEHVKIAGELGITGTPHIFFNGKGVGGFKQSMFNLGLDSLKK
jgi:glutaredoxin